MHRPKILQMIYLEKGCFRKAFEWVLAFDKTIFVYVHKTNLNNVTIFVFPFKTPVSEREIYK